MMLSTIPATVAGFAKLCDWLRAEISIIRTKKWVPDRIVPAFLTRVFSLILELERIKSYLKRRSNYDDSSSWLHLWNQWRCPFTLNARRFELTQADRFIYRRWRNISKLEKCWQTKLMRFWIRGILCWFSPSSGAILQHSRQSINWRVSCYCS